MTKMDRRVLKTKKAIRNSLAELLSKKSLENITVKEIADLADINRKTFYNYYSSIYQVVDEIENEIVAIFENALNEIDFKQSEQNPYLIVEKLNHIINCDLDFYSNILTINQNVSLISKIMSALKYTIKPFLSEQYSVSPQLLDLVVNYAIAGMLEVYRNWFNSDRTQSLEELSQEIGILIFTGVNGILGGAK